MLSEMLTETQIPINEVSERTKILRTLREYLKKQRKKFSDYLFVLDREEADIQAGDAEKLLAHTEIEKGIIREIYAFQKVINPLEDMYRAAYPLGEKEIPNLRHSLSVLQEEVCDRNERNRVILRSKMAELKEEIRLLRRPGGYGNQFSIPIPNLLDITT